MAPRTSWKGYIKLSLVSVPVKAFTANNTGEEIRLNQLHKECNQRVKYQKVCPEHGELSQSDIVSGYEYTKGQYVIVDTSEVAKLRKDSDKSIAIDGFIKPEEVDPIYYSGRTYYLLPDGVAGNKPYALLHKGMVDADVHAIASIVLSGKDQLALLRPMENMLVMTLLSHEKKIKKLDDFGGDLEEQEMTDEEAALTATLISASYVEEFKFGRYKDEYVDKLGKLIQMKIDGNEVVAEADPEEPKILNLMDALKKSVAEAQAAGAGATRGKKGTTKKMAPSAAKKTKKKATRKKKSG